MSQITAVMVDSREPEHIQKLNFGVPSIVTFLETGDLMAATDDGHTILVERKTPDDFLNSLKDDRLFPQLARMTQEANLQSIRGESRTHWNYLVVTSPLTCDRNGKVITERGVTGWSFSAVMGAILSIQEMGVFVVFCNGQSDYADCIIRLGRRNRTDELKLLPPRPASILGPKAAFLASLPGIGIERVQELLDWSANSPAAALSGITDLSIPAPIGKQYRKNIKAMLGLEENQTLEIYQKEIGQNG